MRTVKLKSLRAFEARVKKDTKRLEKRLDKARERTARQLVPYVRAHMPVGATSDLRDSAHADGQKVVVDAPHAGAAEIGSRPHMPPIEPLIAWVRFRHLQGALSEKRRARLTGTTTRDQVRRVHAAVEARIDRVEHYFHAEAETEAAIRKVAWSIARAIAKHGTKPAFYMRSSLPFARMLLASNVAEALKAQEGA